LILLKAWFMAIKRANTKKPPGRKKKNKMGV
jgi:hypothetical protein